MDEIQFSDVEDRLRSLGVKESGSVVELVRDHGYDPVLAMKIIDFWSLNFVENDWTTDALAWRLKTIGPERSVQSSWPSPRPHNQRNRVRKTTVKKSPLVDEIRGWKDEGDIAQQEIESKRSYLESKYGAKLDLMTDEEFSNFAFVSLPGFYARRIVEFRDDKTARLLLLESMDGS